MWLHKRHHITIRHWQFKDIFITTTIRHNHSSFFFCLTITSNQPNHFIFMEQSNNDHTKQPNSTDNILNQWSNKPINIQHIICLILDNSEPSKTKSNLDNINSIPTNTSSNADISFIIEDPDSINSSSLFFSELDDILQFQHNTDNQPSSDPNNTKSNKSTRNNPSQKSSTFTKKKKSQEISIEKNLKEIKHKWTSEHINRYCCHISIFQQIIELQIYG